MVLVGLRARREQHERFAEPAIDAARETRPAYGLVAER
jgi:hypothetical protein